MRWLQFLGGALLLLAVEIQSQGPPFAPVPRGWIDGRECNRPCVLGQPRNCFFHFRIETSFTMSKACFNCPNVFNDCFRPDCIVGGGIQRVVSVINRQLPAPSVEVCEGDRLQVLVENMLETGEATSIHWHGQHMKNDPYMDGVPFITQCPIHYNNNFTYEFTAANPGTHFYHSHVEVQRGDGLFGALIVRQAPSKNLHYNSYHWDYSQHTMIITDWNDRQRMDVFQAYAKAGAFLEPTSILINGYGMQPVNRVTNTPLANFNVERGRVHRFRMINANFFDCPYEISIDNHKLTVISSDGEDVRGTEVDSIVSHAGERFDFTINTNQAVGTYWIRVKGLLLCERLNTFQLATLRYAGSNAAIPGGAVPTYLTANNVRGTVLNPMSARDRQSSITIDRLRSLKPISYGFDTNNVKRFFLSLDMSGIDQPANHRSTVYGFNQVAPNLRVRTPQINHISFKALDVPLLPARNIIPANRFCSAESMASRNCARDFCECPHALEVNLNDVVEMVIFDEMDQEDAPAVHPIHLHGFSFSVLSWVEIGANLTRAQIMNRNFNRNFQNPPLKDTVSVPRGGATIIRFVANNPGYWFMHCHIDVHAMEGMELVLKVGRNDQMLNPPNNFPTCGNYPTILA